MNTAEIRQAIDQWIDELEGTDIENPLEPIKVASALKSEIMKWEIREKQGKEHSVLDYTIIKALESVLGVGK